MSEVWIANASPVIVLAKANHLHLLKDLTDELVLPEAVVGEVLQGPEADPGRGSDMLILDRRSSPRGPIGIAASLHFRVLG